MRRLRSTRSSSMPQQGRVEPAHRRDAAFGAGGVCRFRGVADGGGHDGLPSGGGGRVVLGVGGQGDEGVLDAARLDLEVVGVGLREQVAGDRVGVLRVDPDDLAAQLDGVGRGDRLELGGRDAWHCRADRATGGHGLDLGCGAVGHDLALADEDDAVGVLVGLLEVVRREEDGAPAGGVLTDGRPEVAPPGDVHPGGRLVEDEQLGVGQQGHGEPEPLLLAAGALVDPPVADVRDTGPLHHPVDGDVVDEERAGQLEGLADADVLEQPGRLHDGGDEAVRDGAPRALPEHGDGAGGGVGEAEDHVDRRGLAGAVGAEERDDLPLPDLQVDAADGVDRAEVLAQSRRRDGEVGAPEHARRGPVRAR